VRRAIRASIFGVVASGALAALIGGCGATEAYSAPRGSDEGTKLKEGGASGLDFPMTGYAQLTNDVVTLWDGLTSADKRTYIWSTPGMTGVLRRRLEETAATVFRFSAAPDGFAIVVRCVADL
jgi:hypothetical protein